MAEKEYIPREVAIDCLMEVLDKPHHAEFLYTDEICAALNSIPDADVVPASVFRDCRNELCLKCGAYTQKHLGACDGCRWRKTDG